MRTKDKYVYECDFCYKKINEAKKSKALFLWGLDDTGYRMQMAEFDICQECYSHYFRQVVDDAFKHLKEREKELVRKLKGE